MELYSMPQLDKTSPVFSDAQYEGGGDTINNQRTPTNDVKKYAAVPTDALPLLTSSASWNAVIHHPAEEDSEPDDLPSTVDMDAIKGSPATPLTASKTPPSNGASSWTQSKVDRCKREGAKEEAEASDSEDSDGEDESDSQESDEDGDSGDSDTVNGSGSDSEGSESESCSWTDSDSESGSSSCSSRSGHSSRSSHTHQTFSIRETNFEQGGLKLKIAALKVTRKSSGKDSSKESGKDVGKEPTKEVVREAPREITKESESKKITAAPAPKSSKDKAKFEKPPQTSNAAAVPSQISAAPTPAPSPTGRSPSKVAVANALKKSEGVRRKPRGGRGTQKEKVSSVSGRNLCSMRVPASPTLYGCTAASISRGRTHVPHTPRSNTDSEDESESDEDEEEAEISQIAQELGHIEQGNIAISEHLQEINQEDLAAILPDVVTTDNHGDEAGPPFDGFEDVSSESGKVAADGSATASVSQRGAESSSDMELPEQVVSEAIKRIHIDSEEVQMRGNDSSSGEDSCEEGGLADVTGYSSALLQQFVEKTEILASQAACSQDPAKGHERPEANNEQRLPLKKRHYHISTAANLPASSSSPETPRAESSGDSARKAASSERTISTDKEKLNDKVNVGNVLSVTGKNQSKPSDKVIVSFKEKPSDKGSCIISSANKNNCVIEIKSKSVSELPRNSIDEAIEACITRYTTTSPPLEKLPVAARTVIVTPKKRHRLENAAVVCTSGRTTNVTICKGKDSAVETTMPVNNINKSVNILGNNPQPSKRSGSRSASANSSLASNTSGTSTVQSSLPSAVEAKSPTAATEPHSKTEIDESSSVNSVIKTAASPSKVTSPSSKMPSPAKGSAPASKGVSVGKVASPEKKAVSSMNKVSQPSGKTNLPGSKTTSPVGKLASVLGKISSPSKTAPNQVSKGISPHNKVSSPTCKSTSSPSKVTLCPASKLSSPTKVVPNNASKGISAVSKTSASAANKVVSASSKMASPSKRTKTSLLANKSGSTTASPVRKTTSPAARLASPGSRGKRAQSPANKSALPSAEKITAESAPVTKMSGVPAKVGGILNKASSSNSKCAGALQGRASGRVNKVPVSAGKGTAAKTLISGKLTSPRTVTVCNRTLLSARRSIGLGRGSSKVSTAVSRVSIGANKGTAKTISRLHSSLRTVDDSVPILHNLRVKRANGAADKDDLLFKRNKKKRLIRDVRVHVTKLSPMDLLKKAVGAVKERARRRKSINRTGFPVKKKKKKRPQLFDHHTGFSDSLEPATSTSVQRANESSVPVAPVPVIDSEPKTISCSDSIEILPASSTEIVEHMLDTDVELQQSKRDQSSVLFEATSKPKVRKSDSSKLETVEVVQSSDSKPKEANKRERYNSVLPDRGNGNDDYDEDDYDDDDDDDDDDDTDTESDMVESRPLGSCKRYKGDSCHMVEDRTDEELSVCAADDSNVAQVCDNRTRGKRKRDSSHDEVSHSSFSHVPSKRLRKIRDYDMDRDDIDLALPYESLPCSDVPSGDESTKSGRRKKQPRWRKKFLAAGLFSDYFKEDEPRRPNGDTGKSRLLYRPEEHQHGLLPPPYHCGKYLRQRRVEFRLPYDLWWLHTHSQLPGRDCVPSWNYKKIRTNVYYDVKPTYTYEAQACNCVLPVDSCRRGCGEDCINRMVYAECSPQLCPCRDLCSNQRIQKHEWAPGLEKFMTKDKGWGVKTKYAIKSGEFILEYVGEVVSEKEFKDRMASRYVSDTHHYCLNLDGGLVIDGHRMGGDGRFVNHSCEPNCEMQKWSVNGLFRMALFALRDIQPHEELSYDYNFSLFNPAEGQPCKCGSVNCRGVIGGKSQRINGSILPPEEKPERRLVGRPRKNARKNSSSVSSNKLKYKKRLGEGSSTQKHSYMTPVKPMSHQQRCFAQLHHCFLLRNLEKVKRLRERLKQASRREQPLACGYPRPQVKQSDVFLTQLNALSTPRNIRTRRLAQAEDNPELTKTARLAYVFRDLYNVVIAAKDERTEMLCAPFLTLPSKRKLPEYYQRISEPIDLGTLEQNIVTGYYRTVESFDQDMSRLFANNVRFFGRTSELGITAARLRKVYNEAKLAFLPQLEEILGESPPASFIPERDPGGEEEDVIRCICGLYKDEGMMIQCERCLVWQHCDCVRADEGVEHYLCEQCSPRPVDLEIIMSPQPPYATPGLTYYITLLRGSLQLRQGDTVYVLRDMIEENAPKTSPPTKHTYKTIKDFKYTDFDIFRIERLWKDEKGERFAFGHHYLRPHETYHEPSRKFFPNEVMRVPLYEVVPLDLIMGHCWVLDLNTFCKGRPVGATEEHIYICEYRVDKSAHLFTKIAKPRHSVCTKAYAFETFDRRLKPQRTYTPHGPVAPRSRGRSAGSRAAEEEAKGVQATRSQDDDEELPLARVRDDALARKRANQKQRLNMILLRLLARLPSKQPLDLSFLLEPGRRHRKKTSILNP